VDRGREKEISQDFLRKQERTLQDEHSMRDFHLYWKKRKEDESNKIRKKIHQRRTQLKRDQVDRERKKRSSSRKRERFYHSNERILISGKKDSPST